MPSIWYCVGVRGRKFNLAESCAWFRASITPAAATSMSLLFSGSSRDRRFPSARIFTAFRLEHGERDGSAIYSYTDTKACLMPLPILKYELQRNPLVLAPVSPLGYIPKLQF